MLKPNEPATDLAPDVERPVPSSGAGRWGSDVIAEALRKLGIKYVALNPGSSYRGLHDSLVNHLGNDAPRMLLCLHEESAVALAHGYAKVTGEPLLVIVHSNVGLMHGSMAIFNAWCDRVPMVILGATGPVDATARRPWIDWIHTTRDQAALVRPYIKWDDQPASIGAAIESVLRANLITRTAPEGPVYVTLDVSLQEQKLDAPPPIPDIARFQPPALAVPSSATVARAVDLIKGAKNPLILAGRVSREPKDWARRVAFAEAIGATVMTDLKTAAAFPTDHKLHPARPGVFLSKEAEAVMAKADLVISLDWVDLAGTLKHGGTSGSAKVMRMSLDHQLHTGFGMELQGLPAVDLDIACAPDVAMHAIADALGVGSGVEPANQPTHPALGPTARDTALDVRNLASAVGEGLKGECVSLVRLPLGWDGGTWHFRHPLDYLGGDGGGGIGSGPGMLVGAALALRGTGRMPVAVLGDGDYLMNAQAIWTAARYRIPMLAVVSNNRSFFNDEIHQERMAVARGRPVENKWIGQHIGGPDPDLAEIARGHGLVGIGPVHNAGELVDATKEAVKLVKQGKAVLIDARVKPGYNASMTSGLTREN